MDALNCKISLFGRCIDNWHFDHIYAYSLSMWFIISCIVYSAATIFDIDTNIGISNNNITFFISALIYCFLIYLTILRFLSVHIDYSPIFIRTVLINNIQSLSRQCIIIYKKIKDIGTERWSDWSVDDVTQITNCAYTLLTTDINSPNFICKSKVCDVFSGNFFPKYLWCKSSCFFH